MWSKDLWHPTSIGGENTSYKSVKGGENTSYKGVKVEAHKSLKSWEEAQNKKKKLGLLQMISMTGKTLTLRGIVKSYINWRENVWKPLPNKYILKPWEETQKEKSKETISQVRYKFNEPFNFFFFLVKDNWAMLDIYPYLDTVLYSNIME